MIIRIYMHRIYRELIKKPSNNDQKNAMGMEINCWKGMKSYRPKSESSDRE